MGRTRLADFALAVIAPGLAILLRLVLNPVLDESSFTFTLPFAAVIVVVAYAGLRPAILSLVVGLLGSAYFLLPPRMDFRIAESGKQVETLLFLVVGVIGVAVGERMNRNRRRAEESEARERERAALLQTTLDTSPTPIWIALGRRCEEIIGNPAANALLGVSVGANVSLSTSSSQRLNYQCRRDGIEVPADALPMQRAAREGIAVPAEEYELVRTDGSRVWLLMHASPLLEAGTIRGAVAVAVDISERKAAEQGMAIDLHAMTRLQHVGDLFLRGDTTRQQCLEELLDAAISVAGANKGSVQIVDRQTGMLTIAAHRGFAQPFLDFFREVGVHDVSACGEAMKTAQRVVVSDVTESSTLAGHPALQVMLEAGVRAVHSMPLVSSDGRVLGMLSTHHSEPHAPSERVLRILDILTRKAADYLQRGEADERLRQSETDARLLQSIGSELVGQETAQSLYERIVDAAATLLKSDFASMQALELAEDGRERLKLLAFRGFRPEAAAFWEYVSTTGKSTCAMALSSRERVFVNDVEQSADLAGSEDQATYLATGIRSVQTTPLLSGRGRLVGMLSTHWATRHEPTDRELRNVDILARLTADLIEQRLAEQDLREADRRKDEFLATLAHELRNPLAPVRTGIHLLRVAPHDATTQRRITDTMERQITHIVRLVDDLLELSRVSRGKIELRKEIVDVTALIRRAVETTGSAPEAGSHRVAINLPTEPIWVEADPVRLAQVLGNLLNNAAKYTDAGGTITVDAAVLGEQVSVSVSDTGTGIPAEMLPQVFDLFTQVDRTLGRAQGGLGIGLALVKHLVEMHGGRVEARSDGPGRGSEFTIRLPIASARSGQRSESSRDGDVISRVATGQRCLIVDDNRDAADMLTMVLKLMGAEVRTTYDGSSALAEVRSWRPSVVFLDLGMPALDGYVVAAQIRSEPQFQAVTLVAVSGWGQTEDRRRTQATGFDAHLVKPVATAALVDLLESVRSRSEAVASDQAL